jgi:predicted permease
LIVAEVAITLVLLTGAGLLLKSFLLLSRVDPGIDPRHALTMQITLPRAKYPDSAARAGFLNNALARIESLPGVKAAGFAGSLPLADGAPTTSFTVVGREGEPEAGIDTDFDFCTADYFRAIGAPLKAGRFFDAGDVPGRTRAVIINEAFARRHFPGEDPLGKRLRLEAFMSKTDEPWEITGVVGDIRQRSLRIDPRPCVFRPEAFSFDRGGVNLVVRTEGAPLGLAQSVRKAILDVDPDQPVANVRSMEEVAAAAFAWRRITLATLGGFAVAAMLLAALGLYGVLAYAVAERGREIGIRMALGAQRREVLGLVLGQGMKLAGAGVAIGLAGAIAATRVLGSQLYAIKPTDPPTLASVSLFLLTVSALACWLPARRAARVDPMTALRAD